MNALKDAMAYLTMIGACLLVVYTVYDQVRLVGPLGTVGMWVAFAAFISAFVWAMGRLV